MKEQTKSAIKLLEDLTERAKELTCFYAIEEALKDPDSEIDRVAERIIEAIPPGWQFPEICVVRISLEGRVYQSEDFQETPWKLDADIIQQDQVVGSIAICYTDEVDGSDGDPFLKEERRLIETIADRLHHFLTYRRMKHVFHEWQSGGRDLSEKRRGDWEAVLDLIRQTDNALFLRITNKMLNHLCWSGIEEAEELRRNSTQHHSTEVEEYSDELNGRYRSRGLAFSAEFTQRLFTIASNYLSSSEILSRVQMWIQEDKLGSLLRTVRRHLPLSDVVNALRRYFIVTRDETESQYPLARGLKVLLIESILSSRLDYINAARDHVNIDDLYHLLQHVIFSADSHGTLGGKGAGFYLASQILKEANEGQSPDTTIKVPKTWYIPSDMMLEFMQYNNMDEVVEQKYKELERVRVEYPHVIEMFKQTVFPPEMMNGLSMALDDFGDSPLIVRGSSLLEERTGFACAKKYRSVFLGNQGPREIRLRNLAQAVAEVYASNFGPNPIHHRSERGLLELSEQMGILIQEVVGSRIGPYFLPAYSGVARSRNEFMWSEEIEPEDGLVRLMPGLGGRVTDSPYKEPPVLVVPGRPSLKVDTGHEKTIHTGSQTVDAIDLESNCVCTVDLLRLLNGFEKQYDHAGQIVSVVEDGDIRPLDADRRDYDDGQLVVDFDGLVSRSPFVIQIRNVLRTLEKEIGSPVEIEFASDGQHLYLLQCRSRGFLSPPRPAPIPKGIDEIQVVFASKRFVPNGRIANITHIVYVNPAELEAIGEDSRRQEVESALLRLNELLPKRQFIVVSPIRAGVDSEAHPAFGVEHTGITNTALLADLIKPGFNEGAVTSQGVNFLLDLMESDIHYLPVHLADGGTNFNEAFFTRSKNVLPELVPEYALLADVIRVVDVAAAAKGKVVQVLMNSELSEAVALLVDPENKTDQIEPLDSLEEEHPENYWRWRYRMAEQIASHLDPDRFGVRACYLIGSTKNGTAGPASDIDLLVHFRGTAAERESLLQWLEGWSLCLDEMNYLRTGYRSRGLLDIHIVTDDDIEKRTSYAVKIDAVTDAARPLKIKDSGNPDFGA